MLKAVSQPLILILLLTSGMPGIAGEAQGPDTTIADLSWISGSWEIVDGHSRHEEHWTPAARNALLGMARNLSDGRMVFFEYLRIEAREDGIYYVAQPKGRPGTDFKLTHFDGTKAVFENPQHDFPRRITYQRGNGDRMTARIDGGPGSDKPATTFRFKRMSR
jgi:hypothetical protein